LPRTRGARCFMLDKRFNKSGVQSDRSRAVFILIALAGILPSALVWWFTSLAIRNEQLATAKIEEEAHQVLLKQIKSALIENWNTLLEETDQRVASLPPAVAFYDTVTGGGADGLIILAAGDTHRVAYPGLPRRAEESNSPSVTSSAGGVLGESEAQVAARNKDKDLNAQLASQFAVLTAAIQRNDKDKARGAAQTILDNTEFERCVDKNGRHTLSSIELFILEKHDVVPESTYASVLSRLTARLNNYRFDLIPASQRRFLMDRISALTPQTSTSATVFPTMSAEYLSAQFIETTKELMTGPYLNRSAIEGVWQQRLPSGQGIALFTEHRIRKLYGDWLAAMDNPLATLVQVGVVSDNSTHQSAGSEILLGTAFPGWRLRIVGANAGTHGPSLAGVYVALSVASIGLILFILFVIASMTLRRVALAQQRNTMVATVSHELKTPVSAIKLLVDTLLQEPVLRPDRVREYLDLISRENLRLSQLIENFLSFSRIERTKFKIEKQQFDIADLIREAAATFSLQADITEREFSVEIAPDIPPYHGDAWALNRVILNLLDNAHKYSDPPRQIRISARVEKRSLVISVSDKGIGIREADLEKVFHQFYQADQRLSRSNEGCGLGLSIVRNIVNLHDGTIDVDSKLGVGSTFTIRLPLE
jgi:signal transduction histidine kinase